MIGRWGIGVLLAGVILLAGCAATETAHYEPIDQALKQENYTAPPQILKSARKDGSYSEEDRVLYWMERGIALHYAGKYEESNKLLSRADSRIDELYTTRLSNVGEMLLTNDNAMPYEGDPHEQLYINVFKALNYLAMDDPQGAAVEARKLDNKLVEMVDRYRTKAENYRSAASSKLDVTADTYTEMDVENPEFHSSALSRYIGFIVNRYQEEPDAVRIDYENMQEAYANQPHLYPFDFPELPRELKFPNRNVPVHFLATLGFGPVKKPENIRAHIPQENLYLTVEIPRMETRGTRIERVVIRKGEHEVATLEPLEDVNIIAKNTFQLERPIIVGRAFARAIVRALATREVRKEAKDEGAGWWLAAIIGDIVLQENVEQADLRTVRLLPGQFHVATTEMPPGEHELTINYYDHSNNLVETETRTVTFTEDNLNMVRLVNFK